MNNRPNIIIVMTDQQRADLRKGAGYCLDTMPFLDSFARDNCDIAHAYTPNPTCAPARTSLFTGRFASAHKVRTNHNLKDARYITDMLQVLKDNGYTTALCGKNHTYMNPAERFDFHAETDHMGYECGKDSLPFDDRQAEFRKFLQGTRFIDSAEPCPFPVECELPYRNVSSALNFIDQADGKPFFAWVSFAEPHNPYQVPKPYFDMFPSEALPEIESAKINLSTKGERFEWIKGVWDEVIGDDKDRINRMRSNYHGMLRLIDDQFARLMNGLKERGVYDNTLVIYMSDHGDFVGEYGMMRKGPDLPDVLTHIPMIWKIPGVEGHGRINDGFVSIVDIFPTICDILGVEIPFGVQGKSVLPLLKGEKTEKEYDIAYAESGFGGLYWNDDDSLDLCDEGACYKRETFDCLNSWTQCGQVRMIVKGDYKLQTDMLGNSYLYNLASDPHEIHNLWSEPSLSEVRADMARELAAAIMRADDPLPVPHHRYRFKRHPKNFWYDRNFHSPDTGVEKY